MGRLPDRPAAPDQWPDKRSPDRGEFGHDDSHPASCTCVARRRRKYLCRTRELPMNIQQAKTARDPITFAVIKNALDTIVDEMAYNVMRTARSNIVRDVLDYSTTL